MLYNNDDDGFYNSFPPGVEMRSFFRELTETILLALLIFLLVRAVVQNFKVEGSSMEPTLHSGQYLLVNKAAYFYIDWSRVSRYLPFLNTVEGKTHLFGSPQRGDVVVFRFPRDPSRDFIKRVIGLPGDTVEVRTGRVYINGAPLDEPYLTDSPHYTVPRETLASDNYFVLGDNRNSSSDSHVWGVVPRENIVGKAWVVYWPMDSWGLLSNHTLTAARE